MTVTYSKRLFRFQDTATQWIRPDVLIEYDWEAYRNGIDNILEWVGDDLETSRMQ